MDQVSNVFNGFTNLMDQNIRGVQLGCYSVALVGLTVAMRKVRPFSKFKAPSDIPNHFIKERRELTGLVKRIDPSGPLLIVQHKPLVNIPVIPSGNLPVKISGVNVTGLGVSWLQTIVVGSEIKFVPLLKGRDMVECEVLLVQKSKDKQPRPVNLGEKLVKLGFGQPATMEKLLVENRKFLSYYNRLHSAEVYAIKQKLGIKYYTIPIMKALDSFINYIYSMTLHIIEQTKKKKPQLINVAANLVRIDFGVTEKIEKPFVEDLLHSRYYDQLRTAELYALRKRLGRKYYIKPTKQFLTTLGVYLYVLLGKTYQKLSQLPHKLPKIYAS